MLTGVKDFCRKVIFKITGINSINAAINPMNYFEKIVFEIFTVINKKQIFSGKFKDINFIKSVRGSEFSPKYFGTYENELDPYFNLFSGSTLIDIGCDDGYYSIGLLKNNYVKQVYAFEINKQSINNLLKNRVIPKPIPKVKEDNTAPENKKIITNKEMVKLTFPSKKNRRSGDNTMSFGGKINK